MHKIICYLWILLLLVTVKRASAKEEEWVLWKIGVTSFISRGVYFILFLLIILCILVEAIKNKFGSGRSSNVPDEGSTKEEENGWELCRASVGGFHPLTIASTTQVHLAFRKFFYGSGDLLGSDETIRVKDQLEAPEGEMWEEVGRLDKAVDFVPNQNLQNVIKAIVRDFSDVDTLPQIEKPEGLSEIENDDAVENVWNPDKVSEEQEQVKEDRLAIKEKSPELESALKENEAMDLKLEEARQEIIELKKELEMMKTERRDAEDFVRRLLTFDLQRQCNTADNIDTTIPKSLAEDFGNNEVKDDEEMMAQLLKEIGRTKMKLKESIHGPIIEDIDDKELSEHVGDSGFAGGMEDSAMGDVPPRENHTEILPEREDLNQVSSDGDCPVTRYSNGSFSSSSEEVTFDTEKYEIIVESTQEPSSPRLVTGSEAFRQFLEKNPLFPVQE